jgi:rubrerythrin
MTTAQLDFATTASKTEQIKDTGSKTWVTKSRPEDAELRRFAEAGGGRRTLGKKLEQTWEGLRAAGVANCPLCGGRMERRAAHARCGCCGTRLS